MPKSTRDEYSVANLTPKNRKLTAEPRLPKSPSNEKQNLAINNMGSFRKKLAAEELLEKIVSLISDSRRPSTINHCESGWRNGDSWCRERAFGPFCCSLDPVFN